MRALLNTSLVEEVLTDLADILSDCIDVDDADGIATVFKVMDLSFDEQAASYDINHCFCISGGVGTGLCEM
jgi:hypothetical protein